MATTYFNEKQKQDYITAIDYRYSKSSQEQIYRCINRFSDEESRLQKDISLFNKDEIENCFSLYAAKNSDIRRLVHIWKFIADYIDWCVDVGLADSNSFNNFDYAYFSQYANDKAYYSEIDIKAFSDSLAINPIDVVILAAPFYGFTHRNNYTDLFDLTEENVDSVNNMITLDNRTISVPNWLIKNINLAFYKHQYFMKDGRSIRISGDGLIKFKSGKNLSISSRKDYITNKYIRVFRPVLHDNKLHYIQIEKSGIVYRCKLLMIKHKLETVNELFEIKEFHKDVLQRFNISNDKIGRNHFVMEYKSILNK